jgi:DNA-binding NarL/FixJ family response regulator/class 3 adenylate cyclase
MTSTIMFTDIVGSTSRLAAGGDDSAVTEVSAHLSSLRQVIGRFGGRVTKTLGDGVMAVFESAYDGVRAAIGVQQHTEQGGRGQADPVRIRVGINVGEVIVDDTENDDVFGAAVVVARRLCDAAAPDQILVSGIVEHLLRRRNDLTFIEVGEIELKGLPETELAFEVTWERLPEQPAPRVVVADDAGMLRAGIVTLLVSAGFDVVAEASDFDGVISAVNHHRPDLLVTDIRMPPTNTDEGIRAAVELRATHPELAVLVLSQYVEASGAVALLEGAGAGVGYLLKERVTEVSEFVDAAREVLAGRPVIDATVAHRMMARRSVDEALSRLSEREREVLAQMATGASNRSIAESLVVSTKTIETHVSSILIKLDLPDVAEGNRRVQAVLRFLEATRTISTGDLRSHRDAP